MGRRGNQHRNGRKRGDDKGRGKAPPIAQRGSDVLPGEFDGLWVG